MSIIDFLNRACVQTAVYWGNPTADGSGGYSYDDAVELDVRWTKKSKVLTKDNGKEMVSDAEVFIKQDVDLNGRLYLGSLDDLSSSADAWEAEDTFYIIGFEKIPRLGSTTEFIRKAYLGKGKI